MAYRRFWAEILLFLRDLVQKRDLIYDLAKRDLQSRYADSVLGMLWAFLHPIILLLILGAVFTYGLRSPSQGDVPMVAWLGAGLAPWFLFSETLASNVVVISQNGFLVKKVVFRVSILPIVKLLTVLVGHLAFLAILVPILLLSDVPFTFWWFQILYYGVCAAVLVLGLSWLLASLYVFAKDVAQIITILLQIGFWITPIIWSVQTLPANWAPYMYLNPATYLVEGYRQSLLYGVPFWHNGWATLYYWCFTLLALGFGMWTFRKLRPHFAEVV